MASRPALALLVAGLVSLGLWMFAHSDNYLFWSSQNLRDVLEAKAAALFILLLAIWTLYQLREKSYVPALSVFFVSFYFVILYGLLFQGTEFGMNAHWADNVNRLAVTNKILLFGNPFQDWFTKDLSMFYPPLWFWLMALMAKILQIEAYQTIKYGYLFVFLAYPWALYFAWKPVVSGRLAACITIISIFFAHWAIEYVPYEHVTATLFLPWWLHFFASENQNSGTRRNRFRFYALGIIFGSALFLMYYWWFFLIVVGLALEVIASRFQLRGKWGLYRQRMIIALGIFALSSVFWLPLFLSIAQNGFESTQAIFFGMHHSDLTAQWQFLNWRGFVLFAGIIGAGYIVSDKIMGKLRFIFLAGLVIILLDRTMNIFGQSIQSRKLLEFAPLLLVPPLALAAAAIWDYTKKRKPLQSALFAFIVIASLVSYNQHTLLHADGKFKKAIETRKPLDILAKLDKANASGKVLLTNRYVEMCYVPYFTFIPISDASAHPAGRNRERKQFLSLISPISEPQLLAYALTENKYDRIDLIFLPTNPETGESFLTVSKTDFNKTREYDTFSLTVNFQDDSEWFPRSEADGLYEITRITSQSDAAKIRSQLLAKYPELEPHMIPQ